jgi:hypothetical protein
MRAAIIEWDYTHRVYLRAGDGAPATIESSAVL